MLDLVKPTMSRRGSLKRVPLWIPIVVAVFLLLVVSGVYAGWLYVNRSTPQKTLDAFCSAIESGNDLKAYSEYSDGYQHIYARQQFASDVSADKVKSCTHGSVSFSGKRAIARLRLIHASRAINDDTVTLSQDSKNDWKIDSGIHLSTPTRVLDLFCEALQRGDYRAAHDLFVSSYQRVYPQQQFASEVSTDRVVSCTHDVVSVSGTSALSSITLIHASRVTNKDIVILSQASNDWKIDGGINLSTPFTTLNVFCDAMRRGDYQMAYDQFSSNFQSEVSEQDFTTIFSQNKITSCTHSPPNISGTSATAMLKLANTASLVYSDVVTLIQAGDSGWKIDSVQVL